MRPSLLALAAALALTLTGAAGACADDGWVNSRIVEINDYGVRYQEPFVNEMVTYYGAPRPYVVELLGPRHWTPGDVYYACNFAHSIGRPCSEVAERYEHNRAGGWGMVVQSYNINLGSAQYVSFRRGFVASYGRWGHPIVIDRDVHVRWESRNVRSVRDVRYTNGNAYGHYQHGHAYGHGDHGDHGRGHGRHGGEGRDRDHDNGHDHGNGHGHGHGHGHH